jgi:class 3 adenylate cyclase
MAREPTATITFLFTDVDGSTARWERSPGARQVALARHDEILKEAIEAGRAFVFKTVRGAFRCAFAAVTEVLEATLPRERAEERARTLAGARRCGEGVASAGVISQRVISQRDEVVGQRRRLHLIRFFGV